MSQVQFPEGRDCRDGVIHISTRLFLRAKGSWWADLNKGVWRPAETGHMLVVLPRRATPTFPDCVASQRKPQQVPPLHCFLISQILFGSLRTPLSTLFYPSTMSSLTADLSLPDQSPNEWDRLPDCVFIGPSLKEHDTLITGQRRQSEFVNRELQRIKKSDHG